jgi:hypothetical protein
VNRKNQRANLLKSSAKSGVQAKPRKWPSNSRERPKSEGPQGIGATVHLTVATVRIPINSNQGSKTNETENGRRHLVSKNIN